MLRMKEENGIDLLAVEMRKFVDGCTDCQVQIELFILRCIENVCDKSLG